MKPLQTTYAPALSWLLGPGVTVHEFVAEYWERRWLLRRFDEPDRYAPLLTLDGFEMALATAARDREVRLFAS